MKKCDICGKETKSLNELKKEYITDDIKEVCIKCLCLLDEKLVKIRKLTDNLRTYFMKRFVGNLK